MKKGQTKRIELISKMIGSKIGKLTVVGFSRWRERQAKRQVVRTAMVLVKCECGVEKDVSFENLSYGHTKSCGCMILPSVTKKNTTHGQSKTKVYGLWFKMLSRCRNSDNPDYKEYGARGIKVCERWNEFENFISDIGPRPSNIHTLDRYPNNDGDYEPGNVRWATPSQQARNRRTNRIIEFNGLRKTAIEWSEVYNIDLRVMCNRIKSGWPVHLAITTPASRYNSIKRIIKNDK